jgi:hypothetical protein
MCQTKAELIQKCIHVSWHARGQLFKGLFAFSSAMTLPDIATGCVNKKLLKNANNPAVPLGVP